MPYFCPIDASVELFPDDQENTAGLEALIIVRPRQCGTCGKHYYKEECVHKCAGPANV